MNSIANELIENCDAIAQRWCQAWHESTGSHQDLSEATLRAKFSMQLRAIGEQLQHHTNGSEKMWHLTERLDVEEKKEQDVHIEMVAQEYWLVVDTVREWIVEKGIDVDLQEYSCFYEAIYELVAGSMRRYASYHAEQVRRDRAHYLASVMHQLRTPLSALSLQVELLDRPGQTVDAATVDRLQRNIRRISVLVEGILRLERFQPSEVAVRPQEVHLEKLVNDIMNDYQPDAAKAGLQFEAHVDTSLSIVTDPDLLTDALGNLVQNAVKYAKKGYVIVDAETDSKHILFRVRDSGPGIPLEKQRDLFRFAQPGSDGGAGIGLQIAQHAARAQGGKIELESEVGKGSTFSLRVPRNVHQRLSCSGAPPIPPP